MPPLSANKISIGCKYQLFIKTYLFRVFRTRSLQEKFTKQCSSLMLQSLVVRYTRPNESSTDDRGLLQKLGIYHRNRHPVIAPQESIL